MAQDLVYCASVFARAASLLLLERSVYRYRNRDSGSTGRKYDTGAYRDWLDAVERSGEYASTPAQRSAHRQLLLRTLTQLAREVRHLEKTRVALLLSDIERRRARWGIDLGSLLLRDRVGPRALLRYARFRLALAQIRRRGAD